MTRKTTLSLAAIISITAGLSLQWKSKPKIKKYAGMAVIPSKNKSFMMGWTKEEAGTEWACFIGKHKVTFTHNIYIDSTLVTQGDYLKLMCRNPSGHKTGDLRLPVENVTWYEAVLYCNARSKRDKLDTVYSYSAITWKDSTAMDLVGLSSAQTAY